jgi:hypothetical protein
LQEMKTADIQGDSRLYHGVLKVSLVLLELENCFADR